MRSRLSQGWMRGIRILARVGYTSKGMVYLTAGILSGKAAFNLGGEAASSDGAIREMGSQLPGRLGLGIIAVGLFSYALWRIVQGIVDPEHDSFGFKNFLQRLGYTLNGLFYGGVAYTAFKGFLGDPERDRGDQPLQAFAASILSQPWGKWLIGTAGAGAIALGSYYFYQAFQKEFRKYLQLRALTPRQEKWAMEISRFGICARGLVFVVIGIFLIQAAHYSDPSKVHSSEAVLKILDQTYYGSWLLAVVSLGLIAYGVYMGIQAKYRRIK